jgi:NAD(P)-dependent dehydrogenase (short-subunit alcohol dehydrogenase family)
LTRALAKEVAVRKIRVNAVVPGFVDTPMSQAVPEPVLKAIRAKIPLGRLGSAEDIANLIVFLASCERSGYITGECIECSGMISM